MHGPTPLTGTQLPQLARLPRRLRTALFVALRAWLALLALLVLLLPAHADTGLVLQGAARAGSGFRSANGGDESLQLRSGAAASLAFEWGYDDHRLWQLYLSQQRTRLALGPAAAPGTARDLPLQLTHLHIGGVNYFDGPVGPGPYVLGGLGFTQLSPQLPGTSTRTRPSMNLGIGHESAITKALALRLELRVHLVLIRSEGAFFCSGGCTLAVRGDTLTQAEAAVGLRLGF
jgi:hypothetical protein